MHGPLNVKYEQSTKHYYTATFPMSLGMKEIKRARRILQQQYSKQQLTYTPSSTIAPNNSAAPQYLIYAPTGHFLPPWRLTLLQDEAHLQANFLGRLTLNMEALDPSTRRTALSSRHSFISQETQIFPLHTLMLLTTSKAGCHEMRTQATLVRTWFKIQQPGSWRGNVLFNFVNFVEQNIEDESHFLLPRPTKVSSLIT
jgi:hypothetical protein